jgi:hypothetical protein
VQGESRNLIDNRLLEGEMLSIIEPFLGALVAVFIKIEGQSKIRYGAALALVPFHEINDVADRDAGFEEKGRGWTSTEKFQNLVHAFLYLAKLFHLYPSFA